MTAPLVTLHDGRQVPNNSEDWRHECEARAILRLPTLGQRRAWLESLLRHRGAAGVDRLRHTMGAIWDAERARENIKGAAA